MPAKCQRQRLRCHAATVIADPDQGLAAIADRHLNAQRPGVERVLHQFLDGRGWALHHLTGRNPVDGSLIQLTDDGVSIAYLGVRSQHAARPSMA